MPDNLFLMIQGKKSHIYIVDDDESAHKALKRLLCSAGFEADTFSSARAFLDSVPSDAEGILILDLRMPHMDGFKLQVELNEFHSRLHIIFITAHALTGDREYAIAHGAYGFLQKPFDDHSLLELIDSLMEYR